MLILTRGSPDTSNRAGEEQLAYSSANLVRVIAEGSTENKDACRDAGIISALLVRHP